ncbi:MAG: copper chaperone [Myxococcales bacterium]
MEALLRLSREQLALALGAVAASALCWAWSLHAAAGMHHGASVWPLFAMWAVMMAGMMIPPEVPNAIQLSGPRFVAFLGGYLAPWFAFSLGAAAAHAALHEAGLIDHGMALVGRAAPAAVLAAAGLSQLSPLKRACLRRCRHLAEPARPALRSGVGSGLVSVGSCGVLMLVLFVTGVMSIPAMALLTALLVLERVLPPRLPVSTMAGIVLLGGAAFRLFA